MVQKITCCAFCLLLASTLFSSWISSSYAVSIDFQYSVCNTASCKSSGGYMENVANLLNRLTYSHVFSDGLTVKRFRGDEDHLAYVYATCNETLSATECTICVEAAVNQMNPTQAHGVCSQYACGARIKLTDCYVRYEKYPIVGEVPETA